MGGIAEIKPADGSSSSSASGSMPNSEVWPLSRSPMIWAARSLTRSMLASSRPRSPRLSVAPERTRLSRTRLFSSRGSTRTHRSSIDLNGPFARRSDSSSSIVWVPTFLITANP